MHCAEIEHSKQLAPFSVVQHLLPIRVCPSEHESQEFDDEQLEQPVIFPEQA